MRFTSIADALTKRPVAVTNGGSSRLNSRALGGDVARTLGVKHEADGIGARFHRRHQIGFAHDAANFDARAFHAVVSGFVAGGKVAAGNAGSAKRAS